MPALIRLIDEIVRERGRDTYWVCFEHGLFADRDALGRAKEDQLAWFGNEGLEYEKAAPKGWLEGDPGCFAVFFDGADDPRLAKYCTKFEEPSGGSLQPGLYQMYLVSFRKAGAG